MSDFKKIPVQEINGNVFEMIGSDWMLITAGDKQKANAMTASWGGFGVMWNSSVAYIVIRPQRYTKEFVDANETFSLSFFSSEYKSALGYLGSVSGRDEDKLTKSKLTLEYDDGTPYFGEASLVLLCRKLFAQPLDPGSFTDPALPEKIYPNKDFHTLYVAKITKALQRQF
ncbi:MAG: flavin reductase [Clostridiales bacterium]|jgi:flavin reductase (DIM6/NTAB) family NADH-FMN oxidoreductase RutF|nr:flavin reductase [Clostridiales bacterium]